MVSDALHKTYRHGLICAFGTIGDTSLRCSSKAAPIKQGYADQSSLLRGPRQHFFAVKHRKNNRLTDDPQVKASI